MGIYGVEFLNISRSKRIKSALKDFESAISTHLQNLPAKKALSTNDRYSIVV